MTFNTCYFSGFVAMYRAESMRMRQIWPGAANGSSWRSLPFTLLRSNVPGIKQSTRFISYSVPKLLWGFGACRSRAGPGSHLPLKGQRTDSGVCILYIACMYVYIKRRSLKRMRSRYSGTSTCNINREPVGPSDDLRRLYANTAGLPSWHRLV